jgi:hypothetical protein
MTEWRDIDGFPGYQVNAVGQVKSCARTVGKSRPRPTAELLLKLQDKRGYIVAPLISGEGKRVNRLVHRLVASAFIGPIPEGMEVNHKNGVKSDNRVENLEYLSPGDNQRHSFRSLGRRLTGVAVHSEMRPAKKIPDASIPAIVARIQAGATQAAIAREMGVHSSSLSIALRRKTRKS